MSAGMTSQDLASSAGINVPKNHRRLEFSLWGRIFTPGWLAGHNKRATVRWCVTCVWMVWRLALIRLGGYWVRWAALPLLPRGEPTGSNYLYRENSMAIRDPQCPT
jgi:hypothetical protein